MTTIQWITIGYMLIGVFCAQFIYSYWFRMLYNKNPTFTQYSYCVLAWFGIMIVFGFEMLCELIKAIKESRK